MAIYKSTSSSNYRISGKFIGQCIEADVDDELAANYFRESTQNTTPILEKDIINKEDLKIIANSVSIDLATLVFAYKTYNIAKNKYAQNLFHDYMNNHAEGRKLVLNSNAKEYLYVFVPGLFYKRHSNIGGDFAKQITMFDNMELSTYLIKTDEVGSILKNGETIAVELKKLIQKHPKIIVVSASKGGPDLAYALGKLMTPNRTKSIKAWISIGGVLRGSIIADNHLKGIKRIWTRMVLFFIGANIDFVKDLSREKSVPRHNSLLIPEDLLIIHYVGAPLSSQVSKKVRKSFKSLSKFGPNDGLTTLVDQLTPQGSVITELGLDHYYNDPNMDKKSIALLYTALDILSQKENQKKP